MLKNKELASSSIIAGTIRHSYQRVDSAATLREPTTTQITDHKQDSDRNDKMLRSQNSLNMPIDALEDRERRQRRGTFCVMSSKVDSFEDAKSLREKDLLKQLDNIRLLKENNERILKNRI